MNSSSVVIIFEQTFICASYTIRAVSNFMVCSPALSLDLISVALPFSILDNTFSPSPIVIAETVVSYSCKKSLVGTSTATVSFDKSTINRLSICRTVFSSTCNVNSLLNATPLYALFIVMTAVPASTAVSSALAPSVAMETISGAEFSKLICAATSSFL